MSNIHFELFKFMNEHGDKTQDVRKSVTPDIEKVIKGLECHAEVNCVECPYRDGWRTCPFGETLLADALILLKEQEYKDRMFHALEDDWKAMLKEQEAKWVEDKHGGHCRLIKCSKCGLTFIVSSNIPYDEWIEDKNYCRRCGARMVKQ